ncbi:MAG: hypothetical protein GY702_27215 [Desulfobulbaceae bacterium]|nr:hypothetical protein [Desulfobulbaceae bacterium]
MEKGKGAKKISGTREWAVAEINCSLGCPHDCRYCYASYDAIRKNRITPAQWTTCRVLENVGGREHQLYDGQVMFPSAHDIVPENLDRCIQILTSLLDAGNRVLIVSKPHLDCILKICSAFDTVKDKILFRFTITARDDAILGFWEPGAPAYKERVSCLEYAAEKGFATSVSVEPMLDTGDVVAMVRELLPYISHSIWLGKMNKISTRVLADSDQMKEEIERITREQDDVTIMHLYQQLDSLEKIRWKESIKEVIGLELAQDSGLDI